MQAQTTDRARSPSQLHLGIWLAVSVVLHGLVAWILLARSPMSRVIHTPDAPLWMEPLAPAPKPRAPEPAPLPEPPEPRPKPTPARPSRALETVAPAATPAVGGAPAAITADDGTFAAGPVGSGLGGTGDGEGIGHGDGSAADGAADPGPQRRKGPAELSLWMDPAALSRRALVRRSIDLLMAVPGYRDAVRGSGLSPFTDLQRLRVALRGVAPERLLLAGVHIGGEQALHDMAKRVAAMRNQELTWRGDSSLRATSWVDGSGVDRGLAVHDGAFVIAARTALPAALGNDPQKQVVATSRMREHVMALLTIEDVPSYLPGLGACALEGLRISFSDLGHEYRMSLTAHYKNGALASAAAVCLRANGSDTPQLSRFVEWLAHAVSAPNSYSTKLQIGVRNEEIEQLLGELAWSLRNS